MYWTLPTTLAIVGIYIFKVANILYTVVTGKVHIHLRNVQVYLYIDIYILFWLVHIHIHV